MFKFKWDEVVYINKRISKTWFNDIARVDSVGTDSDGKNTYVLCDIKYNEPIEETFYESELEHYEGQNAFDVATAPVWNGKEWV